MISKRVLITDASYKHTLGIVRSFGRLGFTVDLLGDNSSICAHSKYCNNIIFSQKKLNENYLTEFLELLKHNSYDILIPVSASSVHFVSKFQEQIKEYTRVLVPSLDQVNLCLNKNETYNFFTKKDVHQPLTWSFESLKDLQDNIEDIVFPVIVKSKDEINKFPTHYLYNSQDLLRLCATYESSFNSFPLIQEMIVGDGYGFFALYVDGKCQQYFMHKRLREFPVNGGSSTCAVSIYDSNLLNEGIKILDHLNWNGVAMVEFKKCNKSNKFYLIEINPKYWGSLDLAFEAGIDFPKYSFDILTEGSNQNKKFSSNYKIGLKYHWPIEGDFFHFLEKPSTFFQIFLDTINFSVRSNVKYYDLLPNLYSLKSNFKPKIIFYTIFNKTQLFKFLVRINSIGLINAFSRFFSEVSGIPILQHSNIGNSIYVGCQHGRIGKLVINGLGINSCLNLRHEFDDKNLGLDFKHYKYVPIIEFTAPTFDDIINSVNFIDGEITNQRSVYIHCSEGISRAATIAVAYLMYKGSPLEESIETLKSVRPFINILPIQKNVLIQFQSFLDKNK
jgi:predicted ATP-grasp superfamily ATP-dependent carboligase/protein-tyrosine phosphatase